MKKRIILLIIRAVVSISLIGLLLISLGKEKLQDLPSYLNNASYPFLAAAVLSFITAIILGAVRWGKLLEVQDIKLRFSSILKLTFIGIFFSNFLPGLVAGDAVKLYYTAKNTKKAAASLASMFLDRFLGVSALFVVAVFAVIFIRGITEIQRIILFVFSSFILFLIIVFLLFNIRNSSFLGKIYGIKMFDFGDRMKRFKDSLFIYKKRKDILARTFFISLAIQFLIIIVSYFVSRFLNMQIPVRYFLLFFPVIQLIAFFPVTLGGIGTREWAFIFFFATAAGIVTKMDAFALSIVFYLVNIISSLPGAAAYLLMGGGIKNLTEDNRR